MFRSRKKRCEGSRSFSARAKKDLRPHPPIADSQGREASTPPVRSSNWFGPQSQGRRKVARPFVANRPLEACLTSARARGAWRLDRPENQVSIRRILAHEAVRSGVRVQKISIAPTILHLELVAPHRKDLALFLRAVAGRIPRAVTDSERGRPLRFRHSTAERRFWDGLVATRLLEEGAAA